MGQDGAAAAGERKKNSNSMFHLNSIREMTPVKQPAWEILQLKEANTHMLIMKGVLHSLWQFAPADVNTWLLEFHWVPRSDTRDCKGGDAGRKHNATSRLRSGKSGTVVIIITCTCLIEWMYPESSACTVPPGRQRWEHNFGEELTCDGIYFQL